MVKKLLWKCGNCGKKFDPDGTKLIFMDEYDTEIECPHCGESVFSSFAEKNYEEVAE